MDIRKIAAWVGIPTIAALAVAFLGGCAVQTAPDEASAGQPAELASAGPGPALPHCIGDVESGQHSCYATFREALSAATKGQIADAPQDAKSAMADDKLTARINALAFSSLTTVVIGIDYVNINYGGNSFTWTASAGCNGNWNDVDYNVQSLVPYGWNDVISSFHSYSNCGTVLFENIGWGGARTALTSDMSYVGNAMNDRASSIFWY